VFWLAAPAIAYFGPLLGGMSGWRIHPAHFVERHGLILIIALGESLVAIGLGRGAPPRTTKSLTRAREYQI
jgi:low temperature requirement protein LtrA